MKPLNKIFIWTVCIFIQKFPTKYQENFYSKKKWKILRYKNKYLNNG